MRVRTIKRIIKRKYPNAVELQVWDNGINRGVWFFKYEDALIKTFISL